MIGWRKVVVVGEFDISLMGGDGRIICGLSDRLDFFDVRGSCSRGGSEFGVQRPWENAGCHTDTP